MQTRSQIAGPTTCAREMHMGQPGLDARPVALDEELNSGAAIATWLSSRDVNDFPYDAVVAEFHRVGKHVVATALLKALAGV